MVLNRLRSYIERQYFYPTLLSIFLHHGYLVQKYRLHSIKNISLIFEGGSLLDVGCGTKPYEPLFKVDSYIGLDIANGFHEKDSKLTNVYYYDGKEFPFNDKHFDYVISIQVLEHVFEQEQFLEEMYRVLKPNGLLFITVPFCGYEHEIPYDYGRYTSFGLKYFISKKGFEVIEQHKNGNFIETLTQLFTLYIYERCATKKGYLNVLISVFLCSPFMICGLILSRILPKDNTLYLDNVILAKKL
jgi:SAM-dependent methyltransferase